MRIMKLGSTAAVAAIVLSLAVRPAYALWVEIQVTEKNIKEQRHAFQIQTKDVETMIEFVVTIKQKKDKLSPIVHGRLYIADEGKKVGHLFVEGSRENDGEVVYWFRISPQFLAHSRFEFEEFAAGIVPDSKGGARVVAIPGGTSHWFYLRDFAPKR